MKTLGYVLTASILSLLFGNTMIAQTTDHMLKPPTAKKNPRTNTLHGETWVDEYYWLREKTDPEVIAYLEAENAYADKMMADTVEFQQALYKEMLGRIKQTDLTVPYKQGDYFYYSRTEEGKQYSILCRKRKSLDAAEEVMLDLNELARGHKFLGVGASSVSPDGNFLAYTTDTTGFRDYTLYIKDLKTGRVTADRAERVRSVVWANDNKTLFYVTTDSAKRPYRFHRHTVGSAKSDLLYEEKDELFRLEANRSRSGAYIFLSSESFSSGETRYVSADRPSEDPRLILARRPDHEYSVDHHGRSFYILTNDAGRNFRLVSAPTSDPDKKNWKEVVAHRKEVMLEGTDFFANHYVLYERENGLPRMRVTDLKSGKAHHIDFPEPVYSASPSTNREFDTNLLRFSYQSFVTPVSIYDYNMETGKRELLKQTEVLGGYDSSQYKSERVYATAADGVRVPVSLVYKKELKRDGTRPLLLNGYGSYGSSSAVTFSSSKLSLLNRGFIFAIAHIRGGGDLGKTWHDQGKMMFKKNSFTDFISVAEHLIAEKYTSSDRLIIEGGSAGGLLMGAVANMRPDLFKAVISRVPFVDVINTMLDTSLPLTVGEFLEWGNPNIKAEYDYMKSYSPYDNLAAKAYPNMLVKTSLNDSQVMYWEPAKYVARLRRLKTDDNVLLFKTNLGGGHGGSSGRYDMLKHLAFDYAFILKQVGITK
ncbi:MAG TPA: S9 family peptidase [Blastocatellia bacterium]|nr:S9 family peptidase [Blastocatellia bacterium]